MYLMGFKGILLGIVLGGAFVAICNMYLVAKHINYSMWKQAKNLFPVIILSTLPFAIIFMIQMSVIKPHSQFCIILLGIVYLLTYILILSFSTINSIKDLKTQIIDIIQYRRKK